MRQPDRHDRISVFQDWLFDLTMQQQSVLVLACRGPDGIPKFHPSKEVVRHYRATVLKAAYLGRPMRPGESDGTTFMSLGLLTDDINWTKACNDFYDYVDQLPHHYYMHLLHGAQIIGYKHPMELFRLRWSQFYSLGCKDLHFMSETEQQMDYRLNDWGRQHWEVNSE